MAETAVVGTVPFVWEGTDRKGKKVKGKIVATTDDFVLLKVDGKSKRYDHSQIESIEKGGNEPVKEELTNNPEINELFDRLHDEHIKYKNANQALTSLNIWNFHRFKKSTCGMRAVYSFFE